jgi:hypothetical protein
VKWRAVCQFVEGLGREVRAALCTLPRREMQCANSHNFRLLHCVVRHPLVSSQVIPTRLTISCAIIVAALGLVTNASAALPPGGNFDLSRWKITLPIDDFGGLTGEATEIKQPILASYTSEFFYTGTDGAMVFWCPVVGATTANATAPRTELRELISGTDATANWSLNGTHILRAQCRVTQQPDTGAVIIGQIHGYPSPRLVKLQYDKGLVQAYIKNTVSASGDTKFSWTVSTNAALDYEIKVVDGVVFITVNGVTRSHDVLTSDSAWGTINYYFKAGAYLQDNSGPVTEGGRVSFYQLSATHGTAAVAPAVSTQPLSQTVAPGASVTLSVGVSGTAPLHYQWRANGVNLPGRTNASLSLTNFRAADEKTYSVVVSNSAGSLTSAGATLLANSPLRFINSRQTANRFSATLVGVGGSTYVLQTTTNLISWTPIATNSAPYGFIIFTATNPPGGQRYYRAR